MHNSKQISSEMINKFTYAGIIYLYYFQRDSWELSKIRIR